MKLTWSLLRELAARIESDAERIRALEAEGRLLATPHDATLLLYGDCERELAASRERERALKEALRTIQQWDALNPPRADLLADLPWLRGVVDNALSTPDSAASPTGGRG